MINKTKDGYYRLNFCVKPKTEKEQAVVDYIFSFNRNKNKIIVEALYEYIQNHGVERKVILSEKSPDSSDKHNLSSDENIEKVLDRLLEEKINGKITDMLKNDPAFLELISGMQGSEQGNGMVENDINNIATDDLSDGEDVEDFLDALDNMFG